MLIEFNTVAPKLKFTFELEEKDKINILDITIMKLQNTVNTISPLTICHNNHYHNNITATIQKNVYNDREKKKWAICMYVEKEVYYITKLFLKNQIVLVKYKTKNIRRILNRNTVMNKCSKYHNSSINQL
jgi:hypothetical protein